MNNAAASQIALRCQFKGSVNNYSTACVSSAQAIGEAYRHIHHGYAERVLAGGSEALLSYGVVSAWEALRVLAGFESSWNWTEGRDTTAPAGKSLTTIPGLNPRRADWLGGH